MDLPTEGVRIVARVTSSIVVHAAPDAVFRIMEAPPHPLPPRGGPRLVLSRLQPAAEGTCLQFQIRYAFRVPVCWLIPGTLIRLGIWHAMRQIKHMAETDQATPSSA